MFDTVRHQNLWADVLIGVAIAFVLLLAFGLGLFLQNKLQAQSSWQTEYRVIADSLFQTESILFMNDKRKWRFKGIITPADTLIFRYEHSVNKYYWK